MIIHQGKPLSEILFYHIGGKAKYVLEMKSEEDLHEACQFLDEHKIEKTFVVGLGANLLVPDTDFDGAILFFSKNEKPDIILEEETLVSAYAGELFDDLIQFTFNHSLEGLEVLGGLPSSIGGAIRGNAGAFGVEMKNVLEKAVVFDLSDRSKKTFTNQECEFSYRDSIFKRKRNLLILRGFFRLKTANIQQVEEAKKIYQEKIEYRERNHPVDYPSCGSVFKNIREMGKVQKMLAIWPDMKESVEQKWHGKVSMGYVIKRLGFSGLQVGGAKITEKHANYISNVNSAKAEDVKEIIRQIKDQFENTFGFSPELEAEIVT